MTSAQGEPRLAAISGRDERLVREVRMQLAEAWAENDPYTSVSEAIEHLIPASAGGVIRWVGPRGAEVPDVMNRARSPSWPRFAMDGSWRRNLTYDLERRKGFVGEVVSLNWLEPYFPARLSVVRRELFRPIDLQDILRLTVYRGRRLAAVVGHVRFAGDGAFNARDRTVVQHVASDVTDGIVALSALTSGQVTSCEIGDLLGSMPYPVFLVTRAGHVAFQNAAAASAFPRRPRWLGDAVGSGHALPSFVRRVPIRISGVLLHLVHVHALDVEVSDCAKAPWAQRWGLSKRLAEVACLAMRGRSDCEIATELGLQPETIRTYIREVLARARVSRRSELARAALMLS